MTRKEAAAIATDARLMLTARIITPREYVVLDTLLWRVRDSGRWDFSVTYRFIAHLSGVSRTTAIDAVRKFTEIGLLTKEKRWTLVHWGRNKAQVAARQLANRYTFSGRSKGSGAAPVSREVDRLIDQVDRQHLAVQRESPLERALRTLGAAISGCGR